MKYDFSPVAAYIDSLSNEKGLPGADIIIYLKGRPVYRYTMGNVNRNTLYSLFSCTKPITVAGAMQMVERGIIGLDEPVCKYIPAYGEALYRKGDELLPVGEKLKIRHLFTMSAGLDYNCDTEPIRKLKEKNPAASTLETVSVFANGRPLDFEPGEKFRYSLCLDVLAGVMEAASGIKFGDWLKQNIFDPLGMSEAVFHLPNDQKYRFAPSFNAVNGVLLPSFTGIAGFRITENYESGGAGIICTTEDYGKFAAAVSCRGISADGVRILKPETVDLIRTPQLTEKQEFGCAAGPGYAYGYGVRTLVTKEFGAKSNIGEFGWDGAAGSYILMDPDAELAIVYTQQVFGWTVQFGHMHAPIRDLTYGALGL